MKTEQLYMSQNLELMFTLHPFNAAAYNVTNTAHNENKLVQCLQVMIAIQFALYSYNKQNTCNVKLKKKRSVSNYFILYLYLPIFFHSLYILFLQ